MKIIDNKKCVCSILLPENPTAREKFAAEELCNYIEKISGVKLETSGNFENKIIIGEPDKNTNAKELLSQGEFDLLVPGPEGFIIYSKGNSLLLAGSSKNVGEKERGTLYAVYELLERYLGCSLAAFSHPEVNAGEYIPSLSTVEIPDTQYVKKCADVQYRAGIVEYNSSAGNPEHGLNVPFISWLAKNRYNRIVTWESIYEAYKENGMLEEIEKRGINLTVGHHQSIELFLPHYGNKYFSEKYYETHPEFYKLKDDGTRFGWNPEVPDYTGQFILCSQNKECIKTFANNIIAWLDKNPYVDIVTVWPNDGMAEGCKCPECSKFTKVQNYTYFVDEVSKICCANNTAVEEAPAAQTAPQENTESDNDFLYDINIIGEIFNTYILCQSDDSLIVIDKHAAHERLLYEKLKKAQNTDNQMLLVPVGVNLSAKEKEAVMDNIQLLEDNGFIIEDMGLGGVMVRAVPLNISSEDPQSLIEEIAHNLSEGNNAEISEKQEWIFHSVACRSAIKAGDKTTEYELKRLINDIRTQKIPLYCPHGRPVIISLTKKEIEKQFGRA